MILDAIRQSGGWAIAVPEERIVTAMREAISLEGVSICPESAACVLAIEQSVKAGRIRRDERVVLFNTASATKYAECFALALPAIQNPSQVDYDWLLRTSPSAR